VELLVQDHADQLLLPRRRKRELHQDLARAVDGPSLYWCVSRIAAATIQPWPPHDAAVGGSEAGVIGVDGAACQGRLRVDPVAPVEN